MRRGFLLVLLMAQMVICQAQTIKQIKVIEFIHAPFAYQDAQTNEPKGAEVEFITDILKDMGYKATFDFTPFARVLVTLKTGESDIGPFLTKTPEREEFILYPTKPVLMMVPNIIVLKDSPLTKLTKASDLKGMTIGFTKNQTMPAFFNDGDLKFDLIAADNLTEQNFKKLVGKRIDACIELNPINGRLTAKNLGITNQIRSLPIPGDGTPYFIAISKKSGSSSDIVKGLDARLKQKTFDFNAYLDKELK
jgi:polar amino acid transport system substrate-binding protein